MKLTKHNIPDHKQRPREAWVKDVPEKQYTKTPSNFIPESFHRKPL